MEPTDTSSAKKTPNSGSEINAISATKPSVSHVVVLQCVLRGQALHNGFGARQTPQICQLPTAQIRLKEGARNCFQQILQVRNSQMSKPVAPELDHSELRTEHPDLSRPGHWSQWHTLRDYLPPLRPTKKGSSDDESTS